MCLSALLAFQFPTTTNAQSTSKIPAVSTYVPTEVQNVYGGVTYGLNVHQKTGQIFAAAETMRGAFFGAAHDPNNGTWTSSDNGKNWRYIGPGGTNVKVSQQDPNVIYSNCNRYGMYKTINGGKTWDTLFVKPWAVNYKGMDVFAGDHNIVYVGGKDWLGVSRDGGKTWANNELPKGPDGKKARIQVIQIHPTNPDIAYLAFYDGAANNGIWKTTDAGKSFQLLHKEGSRAMSLSPSNPDVVYCDDAVTKDGGKTWTAYPSNQGLGPWCIIVHPTNPDVAYFSRPGYAVWRTKNGGKTMANIRGAEYNYDGTEVEAMAIDIKNDRLWVGGERIWKAENAIAGQADLVRSDRGYHVISIADVTSTPFSVWAANEASGVSYTTDGKTWITNSMGMQQQDALHRVAPSAKNPKVIYAGHETRLYKSEDGGTTWFGIMGSWFPYCKIDPKDENVVYVSSDSGKGEMSRSADGGETFTKFGKGRYLAIDGKSGAIYAETPRGLEVSFNRGETFEVISSELAFGDFFLSPTNAKLMLSARAADGLFKSEDGGKTWKKLDLKLGGPSRFTQSLDGALWISDPLAGTRRSTNGGKTWEKVWDTFGSITYDPWNKNSVYMGTRGGISWLHPKTIQRAEKMFEFKPVSGAQVTIPFNGAIYANRSNAKYILTADVKLKGKVRDLIIMPRGMKNVTFDGQGHTITMTDANAIFGDDMENVIIENFNFVQPQSGGDAAAIYIGHGRNITIRNCTFSVAPSFGTGFTGGGIETRGIFTKNVLIENCRFSMPSRLAAIFGNGNHTIRNCVFDLKNRRSAILIPEGEGSVVETNNKIESGSVTITTLK